MYQVKDYETDSAGTQVTGKVVNSKAKRNWLTFLMVMGPGLIVMAADNDAGAVSTYSQAGAQYGTKLLWVLALLLPITYFVQEMVARLGIATGEGHAAMIYRRFGKSWGAFSLFDLQLTNFLTLVTEFAAISLASERLGLNPAIAVPMSIVALLALITTGSYLVWERAVLFLCFLDVAWIAMLFVIHPSWAEVAKSAVMPSIPAKGITGDWVFMVIGLVGTTVAPWQLFFQQSTVADKRLRFKDLPYARLDNFVGVLFSISIAGIMMLVGAAAYSHHIAFVDPAKMAIQLEPYYGSFLKNALLLMMINAAILGATTISLSSAWAFGEVKGWKHSLQVKVKDAPGFYAVYAMCVVLAGGLVLIPNAPLQLIIVGVQVMAGLMLPSAIIFLQLLLNDRELLGEEFVNKPWNNVVNWIIIAILFALSLLLAAQVALPQLFGGSGS